MPIPAARAAALLAEARRPHRGIFITGPGRLELLEDELPAAALTGDSHVITATLGNCRCTSDSKAIQQFSKHARVPSGVDRIALGHETVQVILRAPPHTRLHPGDLVVITPGHSAEPVDPVTFRPDRERGVLAALGYSYRHLGGLRRYNAVPVEAIRVVAAHGFGALFSTVPVQRRISLASLAHAEPYACNAGTNKFMFTIASDGAFHYDVPPRAVVAYLGGTARMAMINLTILAARPAATRPRVVAITGSAAKLAELDGFALIRHLRQEGTVVDLIDRTAPDIAARLCAHGRPQAIWTNYAAQDVYDQAVAAIAPGGNINSYAGASDPALVLRMAIAAAPPLAAAAWLNELHHNLGPNDPRRFRGLLPGGIVCVKDLSDQRRREFLQALPAGTRIARVGLASGDPVQHLAVSDASDGWTDVVIGGHGAAAASAYAEAELRLARNAAVAFVEGPAVITIRSRHTHYTTRHQICGPNVPWQMTNTSEPHADDLRQQAEQPIDFDWMLRGVCGLGSAVEMLRDVEARQPFGSYFCYAELPELPYVATTAAACRAAAAGATGSTRRALDAVATLLADNGDAWDRTCEEALYREYGVPFPLSIAT